LNIFKSEDFTQLPGTTFPLPAQALSPYPAEVAGTEQWLYLGDGLLSFPQSPPCSVVSLWTYFAPLRSWPNHSICHSLPSLC
jgi:hypothetical protein